MSVIICSTVSAINGAQTRVVLQITVPTLPIGQTRTSQMLKWIEGNNEGCRFVLFNIYQHYPFEVKD